MKFEINYIEGISSSLFDGILSRLYSTLNNRINYFSVVSATESGVYSGRGTASVLIDVPLTSGATGSQYLSGNTAKSNFTITFSSLFIKLQSYSMKARRDTTDNMPMEWVVDGSIDGTNWYLIHTHPRNNDLTTLNNEKNYIINETRFFNMFRFTQTGPNSKGGSLTGNVFSLGKVEFFGLVTASYNQYFKTVKIKNNPNEISFLYLVIIIK